MEVLATTRIRKVNWVKIVKTDRPHTRIPGAMRDKIQHSKNLLDREQAHVINELHPVAVYVRNIRKRPIGAIKMR